MWFGCVVVSNPLKTGKELWAKNRRRVLIIGAVVVVALVYVAHLNKPRTERAKIPKGYVSEGRELEVHAKARPDKPLPLVLVLHDDININNAAAIEKVTKASKLADLKDFAVVYPEALASTWQVDDPRRIDMQYLRDVVQYVAKERSRIDLSRVYIWGLGEGGSAALAAACEAPAPGQKPLFAAVGVVGTVKEPPSCPSQVQRRSVNGMNWDENTTRQLWDFSEALHL